MKILLKIRTCVVSYFLLVAKFRIEVGLDGVMRVIMVKGDNDLPVFNGMESIFGVNSCVYLNIHLAL